uniref:Uncharacterized protein n=1 Tax=Aegilops tauschii subsp. strangulata TaxID=200361 RepID=A0A453FBY4_AEGTS
LPAPLLSPPSYYVLMATRRGCMCTNEPQFLLPNPARGGEGEESFPAGKPAARPHVFIPRLGRRRAERERSGGAERSAMLALGCGASGFTDRCRRPPPLVANLWSFKPF